ncbi:MAG: molybdopterin-dependent oxidoreductase [Candidatus Bathycorpusculaceae bacterium]
MEKLAGDDILLARKLNGKELEEGFGFRLRLVVLGKYAYKSAMWITRRVLAEKRARLLEKARLHRHSRRLEKRPLRKTETRLSSCLFLSTFSCFYFASVSTAFSTANRILSVQA